MSGGLWGKGGGVGGGGGLLPETGGGSPGAGVEVGGGGREGAGEVSIRTEMLQMPATQTSPAVLHTSSAQQRWRLAPQGRHTVF